MLPILASGSRQTLMTGEDFSALERPPHAANYLEKVVVASFGGGAVRG